MKVAVIPARGGSKRIPRKNIKHFCGKPIIAWSIEAAHESGCFDRIIVSTDSEEIAEVARTYGASVPFLRPSELSGDYVATAPVVAHAITELESAGVPVSDVCCIYATAPFVLAEDLRIALAKLHAEAADFVFTATSFPFPVQRALVIKEDERIGMLCPEYAQTRSQDLVEAFHDAGQFYWGKSTAWKEGKPIFADGSVPLVLPRYRVQDIDSLEDWLRAEWMFRAISETGQA